MILCKYTKSGTAAFMPHLDVLRAVGMCIRRKKLNVEFSSGFNPHMQLFFNQPLPIGAESECEYFVAYSNEKPIEFMSALNQSLPCGIKVLNAVTLSANPNVAANITESEYRVTFSCELNEKAVLDFICAPSFIISYEAKGENISKDVRSLIRSAKLDGNKVLVLRVASGNVNLRADRVAEEIIKNFGLNCSYVATKTAAFTASGNNIDELFN